MPAPLAVDREQVRMLVLSIGVREAARRMNLPANTVSAWSARGHWLADANHKARAISGASNPDKAAIAATLPASIAPRLPASDAIRPADALADTLANLSRETRLNGARAVSNALSHAATLKKGQALAASRQVKDAIGGAAILHGWDRDGAGRVQVSIYAGSVEKAAEVIEVETEVSSADSTE